MPEDANPRAIIGANNPPPADPLDAFSAHVGDLFEEAKNHLDGAGVQTQDEADAVGKLLDLLRTAAKDADEARKAEKKPHDDAGKAVQARWKPLLERCDLAIDTCKKALAPYLKRLDEEKRAAEEAARLEAEEKARQAAEAMRAAAADDLEAREKAEVLEGEAKAAAAVARKAEADKAHAHGGARATALRSYFRAELVNASDALKHFVATRPDAVKAALQRLAEIEVQNGARSIPGFNVLEERRVV